MRVLLKLVLDCAPDDAWRAVRDPKVFRAVSAPLLGFDSLEPQGFPLSWPEGEHPVTVKALGLVAVGTQVIEIGLPPEANGVRRVLDTGHAVGGPLAFVTGFEHTMAISAAPGGKTLYRDQLKFDTNLPGLLAWPVFWVFWQWRALQLTRLAPRWAGEVL